MSYVAHLASDDSPLLTACCEPWQGWQQAGSAGIVELLPPHEAPRPHRDTIRQCQACLRLVIRGSS